MLTSMSHWLVAKLDGGIEGVTMLSFELGDLGGKDIFECRS